MAWPDTDGCERVDVLIDSEHISQLGAEQLAGVLTTALIPGQ
jgi:hypothetical protein